MGREDSVGISMGVFPALGGCGGRCLPGSVLDKVVVTTISVPVSVKCTRVTNIPTICKLCKSILPVLLFTVLSASGRFVFKMSTTPTTVIKTTLTALKIATRSTRTLRCMPLVTLFAKL